MEEAQPVVARAAAERRRYQRVNLGLPGRLFTPADGREARCTITDLSPGGAALICEISPPLGGAIVLYMDGFGRFEGTVARAGTRDFAVRFVCTAVKRERTAEQLTLFLNKGLVDESALRRHERTSHKGFTKFTRADGQVVHCEVMDISTGGVSLKSDVKPSIGEFVLIAQVAGRIARHHEHGVGIEFVGQEKGGAARETMQKLNLAR